MPRSRPCSALRAALLLACCALLCAASKPEEPPLALEPGGEGDAPEPGVRRIALGERVALDELGPLVVHPDCTLRRITNWDVKTAAEKAATQARVAQRNAGRLAACREAEARGELPAGAGQPLDDAALDAGAGAHGGDVDEL